MTDKIEFDATRTKAQRMCGWGKSTADTHPATTGKRWARVVELLDAYRAPCTSEEEMRAIDSMRNWEICPSGACRLCDMDCTARTQSFVPSRTGIVHEHKAYGGVLV